MINVLIVDDDSMVAELNRLFLSRVADFHCCGVAPTVREAREMLSHLAQVDLVLLDVYMQQENGLDLLPALRADARNIDVIMITSAADRCTVQTPQTLRLVCQWIDAWQERDFSTNELAAALQISRVSCRKYLIWLEQINILYTTNHYGITGRPEYRYRLVADHLALLKQYGQ